jgi:beta-glucosidase
MASFGFPEDFLWGCATAAYQIEGASDEDGRGPSVWDEFAHRPGTIRDATTGDVACDHYHRYRDDLALLSGLSVGAYRFSISWPRVIPDGDGPINERGLDFYDRIVDELMHRGIEPFVTLFHWDLPLALERRGGWLNRRTSYAFVRYVEAVVRRLGDRVDRWITLNEPLSVIGAGYLAGRHAPGYRNPLKAIRALHHLLLGHGSAVTAIRALNPDARIGVANAFSPVHPLRASDERIAERMSAVVNGLFMDPIFKGRYPREVEWMIHLLNRRIRPGDMDTIQVPLDFIGVNHYSRYIARKTFLPFIGFRIMKPVYEGVLFTDMDWEVYPDGFHDILTWINAEYDNPPIYITENGAAYDDRRIEEEVHDADRIAFLKDYLRNVHRAMEDGCDVRGYFVWSFLDNFEWEYGLSKRFGLVYVDYETQRRVVKDSGRWYREICRTGVVTDPEDHPPRTDPIRGRTAP